MAKAQRYNQILELVDEAKPQTIVEIGVWNGARAVLMAETALKHNQKVHYKGYDLFEQATAETDRDEFNAKRHNTREQVVRRLTEFQMEHPRFTFELVKGNTRETLHPQTADFVYIDGGHSVETIRSDYEALKESPMVVFDDYYRPADTGPGPDLDTLGANRIVDAIEGHEVLPSTDPLVGGGTVCIAVVRRVKAQMAA